MGTEGKQIIRWLREKSTKQSELCLTSQVGSPERAQHGQSALMFSMCADAIEKGEHLTGEVDEMNALALRVYMIPWYKYSLADPGTLVESDLPASLARMVLDK